MGFEILNSLPSEDFVEAFNAAGTRLQAEAGRRGLELSWIKAVPYGPSLEHLSFFCAGQAYFVQVLDTSGEHRLPRQDKGGSAPHRESA
jgi:hypothetical protein